MSDGEIEPSPAPIREPIPRKVRFEVFKRDGFKCQYCGAEAPNVVLVIDHIRPVVAGGKSDVMNLLTACAPCNSGKGPRLLSDESAVQKQRAQMEELNERREQLEMLLEWRDGLRSLQDAAVNSVCETLEKNSGGHSLTKYGRRIADSFIRKYGIAPVLEAIDIACSQYLIFEGNKATAESVTAAIGKLRGILHLRATGGFDDVSRRIYYCRGILRKRIGYCNPSQSLKLMRTAVDRGIPIQEIDELVRSCRHWTEFRTTLEGWISRSGSTERDSV